MSINLRLSSSANGTKNVFDNNLDFSSFGGAPGASGSTNLAAVSAFNSAYAALSGKTRLYIPPGAYTSSSGWFWAQTAGIAGSQLTIDGYGVTLTSTGTPTNSINGSGGIVQGADNAKETRINSANAGDITVGLKTVGETSRFSAGGWCLVGDTNMQDAGDPPNLGVFEFKKIASIGTGTLTFTEPLVNSYKDTRPLYTLGRGGPATVFPLQGFWDQEVEVKGIRWSDTGNLTYGKVRKITWTDNLFDTYGPCPSQALTTTILRSTATGFGGIEVDKCAHRIEWLDSTIRAVDFQSSSVNENYVNNVNQPTIGGLGSPRWRGGASKSNIFINLTGTDTFNFNEMNYGAMGPTTMINCSANTGTWFITETPFSDMTEEGGGVLSYAGGPATGPTSSHYWAVPGQNCILVDSSHAWARSFQVSDVTQSGGRTYVTTNLPFPLPSTINGKSAPFNIASHPCADLTMTGCTGNSMFTTQSALPAHTPFQSWTL